MLKKKKNPAEEDYEKFVKALVTAQNSNTNTPEKPESLKNVFIPDEDKKNSLTDLLMKKNVKEDKEPMIKMSSDRKIDFDKAREKTEDDLEKKQEKASLKRNIENKAKSDSGTESILAMNKQEQALENQLKKEIKGKAPINKNQENPISDLDLESKTLKQQEQLLMAEIRLRINQPPNFPSIHEETKPKLKKAAGMYLTGMFL